MVKADFSPPAVCPICGAAVPRGAKACPGCGADERTGWDEEAGRYDGLDLPESAFAPDDRSTAAPAGRRRNQRSDRFWLVAAVVTLAAVIIAFVFR